MGVAVRGEHFHHPLRDIEYGDVEGAATEVVDGHFLLFLVFHAVGQSRCRGLVDDALHFQAGDPAGVFGGLALVIVEVGWNGDHGFGDRLPQVGFRGLFHLCEHHRGDLLRGVVLVVGVNVHRRLAFEAGLHFERHLLDLGADFAVGAPHEAFDGKHRVGGVGDGLTLGQLAHQTLSVLGESDYGRRCAAALGVGDDDGFSTLNHCDAGVGGTQIYSDYFSHFLFLHGTFILLQCLLHRHLCRRKAFLPWAARFPSVCFHVCLKRRPRAQDAAPCRAWCSRFG